MIKQFFGLFTALVTAGLLIIMAQMIREGIYPTPAELDFSQKEKVSDWMSTLPSRFFIVIAISHALAAFAAGFISSLVAGRQRMIYGMAAFSVVFIMVMAYLFTYFLPVWFVVTDTLITGVLGFGGVLLGSGRYVSD